MIQDDLQFFSEPIREAFSYIPDIAFFVKDLEGRFVTGNQAFCRLMGVSSLSALVGKTDMDFVPAKLARAYMHDDRKVMDSGQPLEHQIEPMPQGKSTDVRIVTSKFPVKSREGRVLGMFGISRNLTEVSNRPHQIKLFEKVIERLEDPSVKRFESEVLAKIQGMSKSKFEREFKKLFHMSPASYHLQTRLRWARNDLLYTSNPISQIAIDRGFFDQSHFTKRFATTYGITPLQFRKKSAIPLPVELMTRSPAPEQG